MQIGRNTPGANAYQRQGPQMGPPQNVFNQPQQAVQSIPQRTQPHLSQNQAIRPTVPTPQAQPQSQPSQRNQFGQSQMGPPQNLNQPHQAVPRPGPQTPNSLQQRTLPSQQQNQPKNIHQAPNRQQNLQSPPVTHKTDQNHNPPPPNTIYPISSLNPWNSRWTIKARISHKSPLKNYANERGQGCLFAVNFIDASGEIGCSLFNDLATQYWDIFQEGKIFYISKGKIKEAGKWNSANSDYELSLSTQSEIMECTTDDPSIPSEVYNFVPLYQLNNFAENKLVDLMCVLIEVSDVLTITSKTGTELRKRDLKLVDNSGDDPALAISVTVVLWNEHADRNDFQPQSIVALKNARVTRNNGIGISFGASTKGDSLTTEIGKAKFAELYDWYTNLPDGSQMHSLTTSFQPGGQNDVWLSLKEGREHAIAQGKPTYFNIRGTVMVLKHDDNAPLFYTACPSPDCKKKVTQNDSGMWECLKCNTAYPTMIPRYILSLVVADHTGSQWMGCFDEAGKGLLQQEATAVYAYRQAGDEPNLSFIFQNATYKLHCLKIKASEEIYQDEPKLKCTIVGVQPFDYLEGSRRLLELIQNFPSQ